MFNEFVLKLETIEKFGYDPELLSLKNQRVVVAKCPGCDDIKEVRMSNIHANWTCKKCSCRKANRAQMKWSKDEDFFENITLNSAYWAGLVAADGCLGTYRDVLGITLQRKDKGHLEKFVKDCSFTGNIADRTAKPARVGDRETYNSCLLICAATKWIKDLGDNFNITTKKTFTLKHPDNLSFEESLSFIAGVIDGDGCIHVTKGNSIELTILGTEDLLLWIKTFFETLPEFNSSANVRKIGNVYRYRISGNSAFAVYDNLKNINLKEEIPYMERKWDKMIDIRRPKK